MAEPGWILPAGSDRPDAAGRMYRHLRSSGFVWLRSLSSVRNRKELYETLGVSPFALRHEIKAAYMKAAKKLHPDCNPSSSAKEEFQRVQHAYTILHDPPSRRAYDAGQSTDDSSASHSGNAKGPQRHGAAGRRGYEQFKEEMWKSFMRSTFGAAGIYDVNAYFTGMRTQFDDAVTAARHARDPGPAWQFASKYRSWLFSGAAVSLVVTPCVPLAFVFAGHALRKLDQNYDWLLAWSKGRVVWRPGKELARQLKAWAKEVQALLRRRMR